MSRAAKPAKIAATRGYGAEVILHGKIWDDAYQHSLQIMAERSLTDVHPFDDPLLIAGQGTVGLNLSKMWRISMCPGPIGGGGLISGCAMAVKAVNPAIRVIGIEAAGSPAMKRSVEAGTLISLDKVGPMIDGLVVRRVGKNTLEVVKKFVDDIVLAPEREIFDAVVWIMERLKLVAEGAAAAPVAALLNGRITVPAGSKVGCALSGGNLDLTALRTMSWN